MFRFVSLKNYLWEKFVSWLTYESPHYKTPLTSFDRLRYELRPGDVVLVEGRSKVADIIKSTTQSIWTHSFFYIGRLHDIDDHEARKRIEKYCSCAPDEQLIIESLLGLGTIIHPLEKYREEDFNGRYARSWAGILDMVKNG